MLYLPADFLDDKSVIQPALNFDSEPVGGYAWFLVKGPPPGGTTYSGGRVHFRRLKWTTSTSTDWEDTQWRLIAPDPAYDYTSYFDLDVTQTIHAPQKGGSGTIQLSGAGGVGSRLTTPVMRNGLLWTCHTVGLDGMNSTYDGGVSGSSVDRAAIQWIKFEVTPGGEGLVYSRHNRIFDNADTNPTWYYMPSLMVNCRMELVLGFSGSSEDVFVSALYSWFANGATSATHNRSKAVSTSSTRTWAFTVSLPGGEIIPTPVLIRWMIRRFGRFRPMLCPAR